MDCPEDTELLLAELRDISSRSATSRFDALTNGDIAHHVQTDSSAKCAQQDGNTDFLEENGEDPQLNQYWYSRHTIDVLCDTILKTMVPRKGRAVAFLSTPSLFFALKQENKSELMDSYLFDYDKKWECTKGFVLYDYRQPEKFSDHLRNRFDMVVIDPPFITKEVWERYSRTARLLLRDDPRDQSENRENRGLTICTTITENSKLMHDLFGTKPVSFRPSIPNLVYQYSAYTNFPATQLASNNSELS